MVSRQEISKLIHKLRYEEYHNGQVDQEEDRSDSYYAKYADRAQAATTELELAIDQLFQERIDLPS